MLQKIISYIDQYHMIKAGDHILAGVSGGADSVCLLFVLLELRERLGHRVSVVHVEHGIRGAASLADAAFVQRLCREREVSCSVYSCHVPEYAAAHGMSEEEAGRQLRYECFAAEREKLLQENAADSIKIAVAHNQNDNAETMLFHMARGTGISGLCGIAPVRGEVIRPLLAVSRREIEDYLKERNQDYCTDATNAEDRYSRNQIRHAVLPALAAINSRAAEHMYRTAEELREIDVFLQAQSRSALQNCCQYGPESAVLAGERFSQAPPVLQREMLHQLLTELAGSSRDITGEHIRQLQALFDRQVGRRLELPYELEAVRVYEGVAFGKKQEPCAGAELNYNYIQDAFSFKIFAKTCGLAQISKKKYTKCFDYDKIRNGFCIRTRQPGDYLVVNDAGDRQKLKKYLVNEKIPAKEREKLQLLADGSHIMWVVGYRISSYYKVEEYTKRILEVTFYGGEEDE